MEEENGGGVESSRDLVGESSSGSSLTRRKGGKSWEKLVYVFTLGRRGGNATFHWSAINPHLDLDDNNPNPLSVIGNNNTTQLSIPSSCPHELLKINHSSIVSWKSRILFVGGSFRDNFLLNSDKIFAFDTVTSTWIHPHPYPSMNQPRLHPVVFAYDNRIYVFGSAAFDPHSLQQQNLIPANHWGETCSLKRSGTTWKYLPNPPPSLLVSTDLIDSHVAYKSQNLLLFFVHNIGVFSYSVPNKNWLQYAITHPINTLPWNTRVDIFGDILFWHFSGTIYAYDFVLQETLSLYNFNDQQQIGPECPYEPTFLLRVAQGKLCLVWVVLDYFNQRNETIEDRMTHMRARTVYCHKFQVLVSTNTRKIALVHEGFTSFTAPCYTLQTILAV